MGTRTHPTPRRPDTVEVGRRAYLRYPTLEDQSEFVTLMRVSRTLHRPWVNTMDAEAFRLYVARSDRPDVEALIVCRKDDDAMAGFFNLSQIYYGGFCNAMCGYAAFAPSAGQGYLTEGLQLTLRPVFNTLRLHRVEANIQPANLPS